jgi:acyl-coenzyme A thioesterase PaaI-like protein
MRFYMFRRLPGAWFMGVRIQSCTPLTARVELPYGWRSQNPFRSIYFAAQCAAAEMSTGLLAMVAIEDGPPVSMLVLELKAAFLKKASDTLVFECKDGGAVQQIVKTAAETGEAKQLTMISIGRLSDGTEASRMEITWGFRKKTPKN